MSGVHYKFSSQLNYGTVIFEGPHISVCDLKKQIMKKEKLKAPNCELHISNADTKEEYTDDNAPIHRNFSVIVRRVPAGGIVATSRTHVLDLTKRVSRTSKFICKNKILHFVLQTFGIEITLISIRACYKFIKFNSNIRAHYEFIIIYSKFYVYLFLIF
uniref:DWNN domain-containing protein n=1 Tax=Monodelphis domestica TaxID=13616 RepID=A0A5F8GUR5_MONDO